MKDLLIYKHSNLLALVTLLKMVAIVYSYHTVSLAGAAFSSSGLQMI